MQTIFSPAESRKYQDHPKFAGVGMAMLVAQGKSDLVSVSELVIDPGVAVPVHTHEIQADSIYIVSGQGEALVNQDWTAVGPGDHILVLPGTEHGIRNTGTSPLRLFVHHSPPLY
ncbi:cupin domain-containing protein [Desulfonatronovibrio hydrogenovorans]|uniref:cupin domain-containing protein n=1 Tax=Desulfonatronovibrio hydrogenovorans TaxID=53245 RepID=UPI00048C2EE5|nr:cupin domain-containing protein [Desulfonatronovibrio hydrogenovorans]